jgi:hypothetical protein
MAREKIAQMKREEARRARRRNLVLWIGAGVLAAGAAVGIVLAATSHHSSAALQHGSAPKLKLASITTLGTLKPAPSAGSASGEGAPIPSAVPLAGLSSIATGAPVDGIKCQVNEQLLFHIHAHLTIFVNGVPRQIPADVGIPAGRCLYWLHTHYPDGIIHIESPTHRVYTLGDFFDEWGQPLGPNQLGPYAGHVVALYNGKVYVGNPRDIPLNAHAQIQLELGRPLIAPETITFPSGL